MYIVITESNAWEREKWNYAIDISKQNAEVLNYLVIFVNFANKYFEKAKEDAPVAPFGGGKIFAASKYWFKFYDEIDLTGDYPVGKFKTGGSMGFNGKPGYNNNSFDLELVISPKKMYSAMITMRDKNENILYKNFDSVFLTKKKKTVKK